MSSKYYGDCKKTLFQHKCQIYGNVPSGLIGGTFRSQGPAQIKFTKFDVTNTFDGLSKLYSINFSSTNKVYITAQWLQSKYKKNIEVNGIVTYGTFGPIKYKTNCPLEKLNMFISRFHKIIQDNNSVITLPLNKNKCFIMSEIAIIQIVDSKTLKLINTKDYVENTQLFSPKIISMSPHILPFKTGKNGITYITIITYIETTSIFLKAVTINPLTYELEDISEPLQISKIYSVHSFSLTENYIIVPFIYYIDILKGVFTNFSDLDIGDSMQKVNQISFDVYDRVKNKWVKVFPKNNNLYENYGGFHIIKTKQKDMNTIVIDMISHESIKDDILYDIYNVKSTPDLSVSKWLSYIIDLKTLTYETKDKTPKKLLKKSYDFPAYHKSLDVLYVSSGNEVISISKKFKVSFCSTEKLNNLLKKIKCPIQFEAPAFSEITLPSKNSILFAVYEYQKSLLISMDTSLENIQCAIQLHSDDFFIPQLIHSTWDNL